MYIATGAVELDGITYGAGKMLVLGKGASRLRATEHSAVMVLGGEPLGERLISGTSCRRRKTGLQAATELEGRPHETSGRRRTHYITLPDDSVPAVS